MRISDWSSDVCSSDLAAVEFALGFLGLPVGLDVKGKTVVVLVNDPDWQTKETKGEFNGRAMTYYGRWSYKYEEAARQGAAAVLIVHDNEPAAYGWNVVESSNTGTQ